MICFNWFDLSFKVGFYLWICILICGRFAALIVGLLVVFVIWVGDYLFDLGFDFNLFLIAIAYCYGLFFDRRCT